MKTTASFLPSHKGEIGLHYRPFVRVFFQLRLRVTTQEQSLLTFPDNRAVHVPYTTYKCIITIGVTYPQMVIQPSQDCTLGLRNLKIVRHQCATSIWCNFCHMHN